MHARATRSWLRIALAAVAVGCSDAQHGPATTVGDVTTDAATASAGSSGAPDADTSSSGGDGSAPVIDAAPGGLRRLRTDQYVGTVRVLFGPLAAAAAMPPPDQSLSGFDAVGASALPLSPVMVEQYEQSALAIAEVVAGAPASLESIVPCVGSHTDDACYAELAARLGRVAWRRPITDDEVDRLVELARDARAAHDDRFEVGLQFELVAILQTPDFVYAVELGELRDNGERWLTTDEWVTRTSLFLLGRAPDAATFARIDAGLLDDRDAQRALVAELLELPEARVAVRGFFDELLRVREVIAKSKDPLLFPLFTPELAASMREETLRVVQDAVFEDDGERNVLDVFSADYTWVDPLLAELYGLPIPISGTFTRTQLPRDGRRVGVLTHASLLAVASHYDRNSPTRRGRFVQERVLCNEVPPPPGDVDNTLPDPAESTTLRSRLEAHIAEGGPCTGCHAQMDPVGFAFEHFDAAGAWRELDAGFPIDASGTVDGLGSFDGAAELSALVRDDPRVAPCLLRNLYRHAIGRVEDEGVADALAQLGDDFVTDDHDLLALMIALVDHPVFRRIGAPQ